MNLDDFPPSVRARLEMQIARDLLNEAQTRRVPPSAVPTPELNQDAVEPLETTIAETQACSCQLCQPLVDAP